MTTLLSATTGTFGVGHITLTAAITAALALAAAAWRLPRTMLVDQLAVAVLTFAAYADLRARPSPPLRPDPGAGHHRRAGRRRRHDLTDGLGGFPSACSIGGRTTAACLLSAYARG